MAATIDSNAVQASKKKHLGIPEAVFVEDVDSFMKLPGNEKADSALRKLDEQYQKYKYMEVNLSQKKLRLRNQIPQIRQTLEILRHMQKKKVRSTFSDGRFGLETHVTLFKSTECVRANVMLEYDIDDAQALLEKNLCTASRNLETLEEDLDFLRDQFTTTEVNMARVYNWDVKRRSRESLLKSADKS
uniref:Prefoldin subunit 3 n=1 Tax=Hippocampus comes TaxID=109280 RepID=A0A3Q3DMR8_HIPCM